VLPRFIKGNVILFLAFCILTQESIKRARIITY